MSTLWKPFDYEEIFHKIIVHLNTDTYTIINVTKQGFSYYNYSVYKISYDDVALIYVR